MENISELFEVSCPVKQSGVQHKNNLLKRHIVAYMAVRGECTLSALSKEVGISIPSATKLVMELVADGVVSDNGKIETAGGRRPSIYGLLNSAVFFLGVNVGYDGISCVMTDLHGKVVASEHIHEFVLKDTPEALDRLVADVQQFVVNSGVERSRIVGAGVSMTGRVNSSKGVNYNHFSFTELPLAEELSMRLELKVLLENDVRAKCFAEYSNGEDRPRNALFLELGAGVSVGIIVDGELCYGKSGFAGEFGHVPFYDNGVLCQCGKRGCLETGISARYVEQVVNTQLGAGYGSKLTELYRSKGRVGIDDIVDAALNDDNLAVEAFMKISEDIGRGIAFLVNIFNPEVITIGGSMVRAGDCLLLPIRAAVAKYSVKLVFNDTEFRVSSAGSELAATGAAMLMRKNILGI